MRSADSVRAKTPAPHPFAPARGEKGAHVARLEREQ